MFDPTLDAPLACLSALEARITTLTNAYNTLKKSHELLQKQYATLFDAQQSLRQKQDMAIKRLNKTLTQLETALAEQAGIDRSHEKVS